MHVKKSVFLVALIIVVAAAVAFTDAKPKDSGFKNLKVLPKDISADSLQIVMDAFSESLDVGCKYCHAPDAKDKTELDYASDDNAIKELARDMMRMTNAINQTYMQQFNADKKKTIQTVTCNTCHRGKAIPAL